MRPLLPLTLILLLAACGEGESCLRRTRACPTAAATVARW